VPGPDHLVFEVEVGNGRDVRELVYVDAHDGKVVDRIGGIDEALSRRVYQDIPNFPDHPFWTEGDAFPTSTVDADDLIAGAGETYALYRNAFGRDSYDAQGHTMHGIFDVDLGPDSNVLAFYTGTYIAALPGAGTDDIVAHEWTHAYTRFTHNLVSAWQPGALNEAYSNIFGEVVDQINGRGSDEPGGPRTDGLCSRFQDPYGTRPVLKVNSPAPIARDYTIAGPARCPRPPASRVTWSWPTTARARACLLTLPAPTAAAPDRRSSARQANGPTRPMSRARSRWSTAGRARSR
jgi:hypothetical protein